MMIQYYTPRLVKHLITVFCFCVSANILAQNLDILYDFNTCTLPPAWLSTGQGTGLWGVGIPTNAGSQGSSIDGTCMLYFDDDGAGNGTPTWNRQLTSPAFDATVNTHVYIDMDVHYRDGDYAANTDSLVISVFDGNTYQPLKIYSKGPDNTGTLFSDFEHLHINVSQYINPNMRVRIQFWDGNIWGWWAAIDNVHITGYGEGENIFIENFNNCTIPTNWTTYVENGNDDWQFGQHQSGTMDGTCSAFFDDDGIGQDAAPSRVFLMSPMFDGTQFANITLELDALYRYYGNDFFSIMVYDGNNYHTIATYAGENLGGENFPDYEHLTLDLSPYRSTQMQIVFLYDDAGSWNWWVGIDNIQVSGNGDINDLCTKAVPLTLNQPCVAASNINALFVGPDATCADSTRHGIWFSFQPTTSVVKITTTADFNELVSVFSGGCNSLTAISCRNTDEFGFTGESFIVSGLAPGATYFVRVSGVVGRFGKDQGTVCIKINSGGSVPIAPNNDVCSGAIDLTLNATNCTNGSNRNANMETPIPTRNSRSRSSIWYKFVAPAGGRALLETQANFADVIAVYSGNCNALTEIASNDYGQSLLLNNLMAGQTYRIQLTGYFATVEGGTCMLVSTPPTAPIYDVCTNAQNVTVGGECVAANNIGAQFTGATADLQVPLSAEGYSSQTSGRSTFIRPQEGSTCSMSETTTYYEVLPISVSQTGTYNITSQYSPNYDGYLQLFAGSFDPNNPCATYVNGDDDFGTIEFSQLIVTLQAGQMYYIVTSSYNSYESGEYTTTITGVGNVTRYLLGANIHGMKTNCELLPTAPIWFSFVAPASGMIKVNSGADFVHTVSLYEGICGDLQEMDCAFNPSACDEPVVFGGLTPNKTYFVQIASARSAFGYTEGNVCLNIKDAGVEPVKAKIKLLLQGAYTTNGQMRTTLRENNLLPADQPYNTAPWNYNGRECLNNLPDNMVDWVLVELRSAANPAAIVERKAALLLNNGSVVSANADGVWFDNAIANQNYHIVVRHRNHIALMSNNAITLPNVSAFNFAGNPSSIMGGSVQVANMGNGYYALKAGDLNGNGVITVHDFNYYVTQSSALNVYNSADCTLDKVVSVADFNTYQPNASATGVSYVRY